MSELRTGGPCPRCGGDGYIGIREEADADDTNKCPDCGGTGKVVDVDFHGQVKRHPALTDEEYDTIMALRNGSAVVVLTGTIAAEPRRGIPPNEFYSSLPLEPCFSLDYDNLTPLSIYRLHALNAMRQEEWDEGGELSLLFHSNALAGETGEFANIVKKLERTRLGLKGGTSDLNALAREAADILTYLELACATVGIDLAAAWIVKFNEVSEKHGLKTRA